MPWSNLGKPRLPPECARLGRKNLKPPANARFPPHPTTGFLSLRLGRTLSILPAQPRRTGWFFILHSAFFILFLGRPGNNVPKNRLLGEVGVRADVCSTRRDWSAFPLERPGESLRPNQTSPKSRAKTRMLLAGIVIVADVGILSHAGPSAVIPPGFPCAFGLNHWS